MSLTANGSEARKSLDEGCSPKRVRRPESQKPGPVVAPPSQYTLIVRCGRDGRRTFQTRYDEDADDDQDSLDGAREGGQEERARVVLFPGADVKVGLRRDETRDGPPGEAEVEGGGGQETAESRIERIAAMVKELAKLSGAVEYTPMSLVVGEGWTEGVRDSPVRSCPSAWPASRRSRPTPGTQTARRQRYDTATLARHGRPGGSRSALSTT